MAETAERHPSEQPEPVGEEAPKKRRFTLPWISSWPRWAKVFLIACLLLVLSFISVVLYANLTAVWASRGLIYESTDEVPEFKVALVFGTTDKIGNRDNLYFRYRIDAAEELWKSGKVETLLLSGDNRTPYYNEPEKMRQALIARGIPDERIVCDRAGLRTLDSVVRAKKIFGADKIICVSQRFHLQRAIYLAKANDIEAHGFVAEDVEGSAGFRTRVREVGARVKMWMDVNFLDTQPRHLGDPEAMPE